MKTPKLLEVSLLAITFAPVVYLALVWNSLPDRVPTHWGIDGQIDSWGSKSTLLLLPMLASFPVYLLLKYAPLLDPKRNFEFMSGSYLKLRFILGIALSAVVCQVIYSTIQVEPIGNLFFLLIAALIAAVGNYLSTVKPNYFLGIRTPWTLESPENWRKTHQFGGKMMFFVGLAALLAVLILPKKIALPTFIALILISSVVPVIYSFLIYQKDKKSGN